MAHRVVCISLTLASGGEAVGHLVADQLGFRYFDDEVIALAAEKAGLDPETVAKAEQHTTLLRRLVDALVSGPKDVKGYLPKRDTGAYYPAEVRPSGTLQQKELRRLIQEAIVAIARRGDAVIVAHAGSMALANDKGVLRVLVTASPKTRAHRLWESNTLVNEDEYVRAVMESDRDRLHYFERFFDVKEELPTHYDLVVNTDVIRIDQAVAAVVGAATA
jgi:cytidylate kinase